MLSEAAKRTKREHLRKVGQGIVAVVETIAPRQEDETWAELTRSGILDAQFNARKMARCRMQIDVDHSIHALAAAYPQSEARLLSCRFCQSLLIYSHSGKFKIYSLKLQNTNWNRMEEGNPYQLFLNTVLA